MESKKRYEEYLGVLSERLERFFRSQEPYISCKAGCSYCCEIGSFPFSKLEYEYLKIGFDALDEGLKNEIIEKVRKIRHDKVLAGNDCNYLYECPFLIDKKCCVYENRGIICRTFGLPYYDETGRIKMPACINVGLNYSEVYDKEAKMISSELFEQKGYEVEPVAFNLDLDFLINSEEAKSFGLGFGEQKALVDWFEV